MKITVLGGTGYAGRNIVAEAAARGHEVTSWSRSAPADPVDGVQYRTGSALEEATRGAVVTGADAVVEALAPRGELEGRLRGVVADLAQRAQDAGVRLGVIGGAGSLQVAEGGPRLVDTEGFPPEYRPESLEAAAMLADLRAWDGPLDWFLVSPAAAFGGHAPGERTGTFRIGGDVLLADADGNSYVSGPDLAVAIVDELERPAHHRQRFTVAY